MTLKGQTVKGVWVDEAADFVSTSPSRLDRLGALFSRPVRSRLANVLALHEGDPDRPDGTGAAMAERSARPAGHLAASEDLEVGGWLGRVAALDENWCGRCEEVGHSCPGSTYAIESWPKVYYPGFRSTSPLFR